MATTKKPKPMTKEETARRQKKTKAVRTLAGQIQGLRQRLTKDMKSDDERIRLTALVVAMMDRTAERVGNDESAKEGHFGVTGFQKRHVKVEGSVIKLKYVGKSGVDHDKEFQDAGMAKLLKECLARCKKDKDPVFRLEDGTQIHSPSVNKYLEEFDVTAKDIRGYAANAMMVKILNQGKASSDPEERKKKFRETMKTVAEKVGHQQATLKQHYLLPTLEQEYVGKGKVPKLKEASASQGLTGEGVRGRIAQRIVENLYYQQLVENLIEVSLPQLIVIHGQLFGREAVVPFGIRVGINDWDLPEGKVGSLNFPDNGEEDALLTVSPSAFEKEGDLWGHIVVHELIHAVVQDRECPHGPEFQRMAEVVGLPEEYRD